MHTEPLTRWQIKDFDPGTGAAGIGAAGVDGWVAATAPGDTHMALVAAGRLPDPFQGRGEHEAPWVAQREWWWRTCFNCTPAAPGERVELVFDGLDTFAAIYLNGALLGRTDNMFRSHRFEVGGRLAADGANTLTVVFAPAEASVQSRELNNWGSLFPRMGAMKRNFIRKAQYGWGWDWGPNLPGVGVWKEARIERWRTARIESLGFATLALNGRQAELSVLLEVAGESSALRAEVELLAPDGSPAASHAWALVQGGAVTLGVAAPQLWWTADLGEQPLYTLRARLYDGASLLHAQQRKVGIRTLALDTSADPDEHGAHFFRFVLNGVPIFARGANWIPASSFVGALDAPRYRELLEPALRANMNMLRVWGGGIYEHDAFYELCDELGLLVWQDFMFACAAYPEDDAAFVDNVRQEVRDQVRRLRHHPSLALWCGNNECQMIQFMVDQVTRSTTPVAGTLYYEQLLPQELAYLDPHTPYWPGSPAGGPSPNSMRAGDVHDWTVWHGIPPVPDRDFVGSVDRSPAGVAYTRYAENSGRFISEFGIHAAPVLETLRRWLDPADLHLDSPGFLDRIKDDPKNKVDALMEPVTGLPRTLEQYVDFTMLTQAEGLKFALEHFRRRKPHCSGTLIWQYNDCWPCVSWSLLDYDCTGKAAFYAVARAYAPVLASFRLLDDGQAELWITNDTLRRIEGSARVELVHLAGGSDWSIPLQFEAAPNSSAVVWRGQAPAGARDRMLCVHALDGLFPANRLALAPVKELALRMGARPAVEIEQAGPNALRVRLLAEVYLLGVQLTAERAGLQFSDNYFDLRPGETREVLVSDALAPLAAPDITVSCWNERFPQPAMT